MTNFRNLGRSRWVVMVVLAGLLVASCGNDDTGDASGDTTGADEPTLTRTSLQVGILGIGRDVPLVVAVSQGFFADEGLDVTLEPTQSGQPMIAAITGGSLDFGLSGVTPLVHAVNNDIDLLAVAQLGIGSDLSMQVRREAATEAGIDPDDEPPAQLAATRGSNLRIGVGQPGAGVHAQTTAMLEAHGVTIDSDVTLLPYETPDALVSAFTRGEIDAYAWVVPHSLAVPDDEIVRIEFGPLDAYTDALQFPIITRGALLRDHPETVAAFMRGLVNGWLYTQEHSEAAGEDFKSEYLPDMDDALWDRMWSVVHTQFGATPAITADGVQRAIDIAAVGAPDPIDVSFDDLVDNSFINAAIEKIDPSLLLGD